MRTTRNWCGGSPGTTDGQAWELVAANAYVVVHTPEHIVPGYSRKRDAFRPFEGKGGKGSSAETTKRATFIGSRKHDLAAFPLSRLRGVRGFTFLFEIFDSLSFGVRIQSFFCL